MVWFRVDDSFYRGKKVRRLGDDRLPAVGLWSLCGAWSADNLTDGFVPWTEVERWDDGRSLAKRLIDVDLWAEDEEDGESGIRFHDWSDWNITAAEVKRKRRDQAERVRRFRAKRAAEAAGNALHDGLPDASQPTSGNALRTPLVTTPLPDPTRPVSTTAGDVGSSGAETLPDTSASGGKPNRGTRIPDPFLVTAEMVAWAREHAPNVDGRLETAQFCDYWSAKAGRDAVKRDWVATWRAWMRKAEQQAGRPRRGKPPTDADWDALK